MAETIRRIEYFYVTVSDKPGAGLGVLTPLKEAGVNLVAYLGFPSGKGKSQVDLVPEDSARLRAAAEKAGLKLSHAKKAFLVQGDDRAGVVADLTGKLAEAKINITAAAAAAAGGGRYGLVLWVGPKDYDRAARALGA